MEDSEFRRLELYLKSRGVQCYRFMDRHKVDTLYRSGYKVLFFSFFGENVFTGDAESILLVRPGDDRHLSRHLLEEVQRFGNELVSREKAA
ncbi:hypothetical protein A7E78_07245 [Syntrophotalea acetylenivorans]|uniref:Uncharacterized protein n=1 Tax=Syntrophotalea acetylenivorans TaxID=1842532 RepID=A0A1L3GNZ6_9BACT|nr:hypothetical protein [Syntrophotalea acetylenivorans]APG27653.1 hypothetical protein A7E78_07245 [Syntrophotalea acetylenivorans]